MDFFLPSSSVKLCQSRQLPFINEAGKTAVGVCLACSARRSGSFPGCGRDRGIWTVRSGAHCVPPLGIQC